MKTLILFLFCILATQAHALSPEERKKLFHDSIQNLKATGIEKAVPQINQKFPDEKISNKKVSDWVKSGPLLLVVYRGGWCPYCMKQLKDIQENIDTFTKHNVTIIAMSPETEAQVRKTKNKNNLTFNLVSDKNGDTLRKLGLIFRVDDKVASEYKSLGINLSESQGNTNQELPVPATYLIGSDRKVLYGFIDADYTKRPSVKDILSTLEHKD